MALQLLRPEPVRGRIAGGDCEFIFYDILSALVMGRGRLGVAFHRHADASSLRLCEGVNAQNAVLTGFSCEIPIELATMAKVLTLGSDGSD